MIWDILEIEMTDDVDAIKRAYARKLAQNHPEEKPMEFQELQQAYQAALVYAKNSKEGDRIQERWNQPENPEQAKQKTHEKTSQKESLSKEIPLDTVKNTDSKIPDYIKNIDRQGEAGFEDYKTQDQKRYMKKVLQLFERDNKVSDTAEAENLLTSNLFHEIALQEEFAKELKKQIGYGNYQHIKLILILQKEYSNLHQSYYDNGVAADMEEFFTYIKKSYQKITTARVKKFIGLTFVFCIAALLGTYAYKNSDRYLLRYAPNSTYVAEVIKQRYGIEIDPSEIQVETTDNPYFSEKSGSDRIRNYWMKYKIGDTVLSWEGIFTPNMHDKSEIAFNLEQEIVNFYIQQNLKQYTDTDQIILKLKTDSYSTYMLNTFNKDQDTIQKELYLKAEITEVKSFLDSFSKFTADLFNEPAILSGKSNYQFTVYLYNPAEDKLSLKNPDETKITLSAADHEIDKVALEKEWAKKAE